MSTRHARAADKELNDKHTKVLNELLQKDGNKTCADCRKKDPRWASWNLGIFICIRCSGTHRSLGTHISQVKSVDLDTWIPKQVDSMVGWGNYRANIYWEAELNGRLPTENNMDMWIREKYQHRRWASKGPVPYPSMIETDNKRKPENCHFPALITNELQCPSASRSNCSSENIAITDKKAAVPSSPPIINMASFQKQLSGLSLGGGQSSGLIPKAPPGSSMSWTNFLTTPKPADT